MDRQTNGRMDIFDCRVAFVTKKKFNVKSATDIKSHKSKI